MTLEPAAWIALGEAIGVVVVGGLTVITAFASSRTAKRTADLTQAVVDIERQRDRREAAGERLSTSWTTPGLHTVYIESAELQGQCSINVT